jgi:hypothetical protein
MPRQQSGNDKSERASSRNKQRSGSGTVLPNLVLRKMRILQKRKKLKTHQNAGDETRPCPICYRQNS